MNPKKAIFVIVVLAIICPMTHLYAANVSITVNAASPIRTIPMTLYGANLASWDGSMGGGNTTFNNLMKAIGEQVLSHTRRLVEQRASLERYRRDLQPKRLARRGKSATMNT